MILHIKLSYKLQPAPFTCTEKKINTVQRMRVTLVENIIKQKI